MATFKEMCSALNLLYNTELSVPVDIESYIDFQRAKSVPNYNEFCETLDNIFNPTLDEEVGNVNLCTEIEQNDVDELVNNDEIPEDIEIFMNVKICLEDIVSSLEKKIKLN